MDKKKVVMISGEDDLCKLVKMNLEESGEFIVETTNTFIQAEKICQTEKQDVLFVDTIMSKMIGAEVIKGLKSQKETAKVPIIITSGYDEGGSEKKDPFRVAELYSADNYIPKPFTTEDLKKVIRETLKV